MAMTVILWAGAVAAGAVSLFLVAAVLFVLAAAVSGLRDMRRKAREQAAARDLMVRAFTGAAKDKAKRRG